MFTTKKNSAMNTGGITAAGSRGTARSARPAMEVRSCQNPAGRALITSRQAGRAMVSVRAVMTGPPGRSVFDVGAGQFEEHVIQRRGAQGQVAYRHRAAGQRHRHAR